MGRPLTSFKNPNLRSSFTFAWQGLVAFQRISRRNTLIMVAAGGGTILLGIGLGVSRLELAMVILGIAMVAVAEMLNTSVEAVVDHVSPQWHVQAKIAKDVGAASALVAVTAAFAVGLLIYIPYLLRLLHV